MTGRGGLLQLLNLSLSPCCPYHLAVVSSLRSARAMPCCLRPEGGGSASRSEFCFEATCGSLSLRPGDSLTILKDGFVGRLHPLRNPPRMQPKLWGFWFYPCTSTEHVCFSLSFLDTLARQNDDHPLNQQLANSL